MKKASLLLVLGLAMMLGFAATPKANARVVVGVGVGIGGPVYVPPAPVYVAPPVYVNPYVAPVPYAAYVPGPYYRHVYVAPRPVFRGRYYARRYAVRRDFRGYRR
jgi:hypothetical protein